MNAVRLFAVLGSVMLSIAGCDKDQSSTDPESGSNLLGTSVKSNDSLGSSNDSDDLYGGGDSTLEDDGEEITIAPRPELPKPSKPVEQCKTVKEGKKKVKQCAEVDPKPKISAAHGVYALLGDFRWGQTTTQVFKLLSREIETEYTKRQETSKDPTEQDANRRWRAEQLQAIKANHTKFTTGSKHRWGVSLIQYEYENDADEEMLWVRTAQGLRKFYFFKNGELWKVFYAYSTDVWPGKSYPEIVDEKFKKWFGPSPVEKVTQDPETAEPLLRYYEWEAQDGEKVRSFDLTQVHGVVGLAVVDGNAERNIGQRLPNTPQKREYKNVVNDVLGDSDVCYTESGEIVECKGNRD